MKIQELDFSVNLLDALLWQHNEAPRLESLMRSKDAWYVANQRDFWTNWIRDVFDLRTANAFGLQVWSRILGVPLQVAISPSNPLKPGWGFGAAAATFTRASGATYKDFAAQKLHLVGNNVPRYRGPNNTGLLLEQGATNLFPASEDFTNAAWVQAGAAATLSPAAAFDPYGTSNKATTITSTATGLATLRHAGAINYVAGNTYTLSVFVRRAASGAPAMTLGFLAGAGMSGGTANVSGLDLTTRIPTTVGAGVSAWGIEDYADGWMRVWVKAVCATTASATTSLLLGPSSTTSGTVIVPPLDIFGAQLEVNSLSTYIPSLGTSGVRAADSNLSANVNKNFNHGGFSNATGGSVALTIEQQRILLRLRYFQMTSRCTTPDINRIMKLVFSSLGNAYVLDTNDMSFVIYAFDFSPGSQLAFLLEQFDMLPRPAGVGVKYNVITRPVFGFNNFNRNFNHGTFAKDKAA